MKRATMILGALALLLGGARQAEAGMFAFTYSDTSGNVGNGTLTAGPSGLADDSLWATSGTLNLTASSDGNASVGTYSLLPAGPTVSSDPYGSFSVDNLIYPANDAASGVNPGAVSGNPSYLTNDGLLFGLGGLEVNIWGNGAGDYALYTSNGPGSYPIAVGSGGTFTLTAVPEPATLTMLGIGIAGLAGYGWRRRKQQAATA